MPPNIFFLCLTLHPAAVAGSAHDSAAVDIFWAGLCRPALDTTQVYANMPSAIRRLSKPAVSPKSVSHESVGHEATPSKSARHWPRGGAGRTGFILAEREKSKDGEESMSLSEHAAQQHEAVRSDSA